MGRWNHIFLQIPHYLSKVTGDEAEKSGQYTDRQLATAIKAGKGNWRVFRAELKANDPCAMALCGIESTPDYKTNVPYAMTEKFPQE